MVRVENGSITISIQGDESDLVDLQESLLYLLGNQNCDTMPTGAQVYAITKLLQAMCLNEKQLKRGLKAA